MPNRWSTRPLGDLCERDRGITYGIVKVGDYVPGGVPVIRGGDIRDDQVVFDDAKRVTNEVSQQFQRTILRGGEILVNLIAEPGHCAIAHESLAGANVSRDVAVVALSDDVDHRFVNFVLKSPAAMGWLAARLQGSVTQKINLGTLRELPVPYPEIDEQHAIASILGSLDDKIELNRSMNETLEDLARTIFKSWFVDFDPVRAKAEGIRPVGMDDETAALFPSRFVDSEMGEIPEGWDTTTLGNLCKRGGGEIQTGPFGSQLHASDYVEEGIPSVMPKNLKDDRISVDGIARVREEDAERLSRHCLQPGDIVYSRRGDVERCALVTARERGWLCGTGCLRVRLGSNGADPVYVFGAVTTDQARSWVVRHAHGATMPNLNTTILGELPLVDPPVRYQSAFERAVGPLLGRRDHNWTESNTLARLRDLLLPKLISGELRVPDADKLAAEAGA